MTQCNNNQGKCNYCGFDGLCCKKGLTGNGCDGSFGGSNQHQCALKGMLQILWERGFIDTSMTGSEAKRYYNVEVRKDRITKEEIEGTSLKAMISNLADFRNEDTLLQHRAKELGVQIDCSPKYHPEIAGEAIESCWGLSKNTYRFYRIEQKRSKENFFIQLMNVNNAFAEPMFRIRNVDCDF